MRFWILLAIMAGALLVAVLNVEDGAVAGLDSNQLVSFGIAATLLLFVGGGLLRSYGGRYGQAARDLSVWVALTLALVLGYSFRDEFNGLAQRITGELSPPGDAVAVGSTNTADRAVRIRKRPDGHFVARTTIDKANLTMLVDTGASTVVLKPTDARAAGINIDTLNYTVPVRTANGTAYAASVRIKRMVVGGIVVDGVEALVAKPGALNESLLGMSFLRRLRSYEFSGDFLTLRS